MTEEERNWNAFSNELLYGGVTVAQCRTTDDAQFVFNVLLRNGILSGILVPADKMDLRLPQIRVAPEDEEAALQILSEPLPPGMRQDDPDPEFEIPPPPLCRSCSSDQVVLDGIEPGNRWRCVQCGEAWTEMVGDPEAEV